MTIYVETWCNGDMESRREIDHNDRESRVWLGRHCYWAFRNGREIRTGPIPA